MLLEEEEEAGGLFDRIHQAGPLAAVVHVAPSGPVSDRGPAAAVVVLLLLSLLLLLLLVAMMLTVQSGCITCCCPRGCSVHEDE